MSETPEMTDEEAAELQARLDAHNQAKEAERNAAQQAKRDARAAEIQPIKTYVESAAFRNFRDKMSEFLNDYPHDALAIHFQGIVGSLDRVKREVETQT